MLYLITFFASLASAAYFFLRNMARKRTSHYNFAEFQFEANVPTPDIANTQPSVYLSLVVPAYNEEERLPVMLDATLQYLETRKKSQKVADLQSGEFTYEIIVVDDGSKDGTTHVVKKYIEKYGSGIIRLLCLKKNRGKGFATKQGMLRGRGQYLLMLDADGATDITTAMEKLELELSKKLGNSKGASEARGIAIGSRAHLVEESQVQRAWYRTLAKMVFIFILNMLSVVRDIKDTQCGFKLFTRRSARECFSNLHLDRWSFDLEMLMIAQKLNTPIVEVPVKWEEIPGSKLNLLAEGFNMPRDMALIRLFYALGFWEIRV